MLFRSLGACCHPERVLVPVAPRPCITRPAPQAPEGAAFGSPRWIAYYRALSVWVEAAETACGVGASINPAPADTSLIDAGLYGERVR